MNQQDLKQKLEELGFKIYDNDLTDASNMSRWYACKRLPKDLRYCDCNDKPPQLVIHPHFYVFNGFPHRTCEVSITGEYDGVWYDLKAYSLLPEDLLEKLDSIEVKLIAAWEGLV